MIKLGDLLFAGLTSGAIYAVFALCLALLFRVAVIINLAVGDFAMLGAMGAAFFVENDHWNTALAIAVVLALIGAFAWVYDLLVLRTALEGRRNQDTVTVVFFYSIALAFFIEGVAYHFFGTDPQAAPPMWNGPSLVVFGMHIQRAGVIVILLAALTGSGVALYMRHSLRGKAFAACGENPLGARIVGIRQASFRRGMFVAMAVLAGIFGILVSPITGFVYNSGSALGSTGLVAAALAGFIRPGRAVLMGVLIGLAESLIGGYVHAQFQEPILYAGIVALILLRPQLLGAGNVLASS